MQVQVDRQLLDERRVAGHAGRLLEPVGDERGEHLQLTHARANGDPDRDGARGDHHPWHPGEAGAASQHADDRHGEHNDALDVVRDRLGVGFAGEQPPALGGRGDALLGEEHAVDRVVGQPADGLDERVARLPGARSGVLARGRGAVLQGVGRRGLVGVGARHGSIVQVRRRVAPRRGSPVACAVRRGTASEATAHLGELGDVARLRAVNGCRFAPGKRPRSGPKEETR